MYSAVVNCGRRIFAKETEPWGWALRQSLDQPRGWSLEIDNNQLRAIIEADAFTTIQEVAQERSVNHSMFLWNLKQTGKWISSTSGCPVSWLQIKKVVILKCHLLLFYATKVNHFSIRLWCEIKSGLNRTIGNDQLSGSTEKKLQSTSQSQTCTKKRVSVTVWWFAARLIY